MKIFNVFSTALCYFLSGVTFMAGLWWLMIAWIVLGTASLFVCMWG